MPQSILVLDDDLLLLEVMSEVISTFFRRDAVVAASVTELQERETEALGSVVAFLDINLGNGQPSGIDAYRWLRQRGYRGRIYFFTGHARAHPQVAEALRIGDAELVAKPISVDRLRELIEIPGEEHGRA